MTYDCAAFLKLMVVKLAQLSVLSLKTMSGQCFNTTSSVLTDVNIGE